MITRFQNLHITSRLISAYFLHCSQIPINTLFCQFNSLLSNTEMYEAINKLRNYRIIYANFIHEYGVNFHELYLHAQNQGKLANVCLHRFSSIFESTIPVLFLTCALVFTIYILNKKEG